MRQATIIMMYVLLSSGCTDSDLKKVSKGLVITADSIGELQTVVIAASGQNLIGDSDTRAILELCLMVNQAGKDATAITRGISKLDNPSKAQLVAVLNPIITAVQNALNSGLLGIKDEALRQKLRGILLTIQTTLSGIQLTLAGGT